MTEAHNRASTNGGMMMDQDVYDALRAPRFMVTFGNEYRRALRITWGRLSQRGRWHGWQPCVFLIVDGRRVGGHD